LTLIFIRTLGLAGVALATLIPSVAITAVLLPRYLCQTLKVSLFEWLRQAVGPGVVLFVAMVVIHTALWIFMTSVSYFVLFVKFGTVGMLSAAVVGLLPRSAVTRTWSEKPAVTAG